LVSVFAASACGGSDDAPELMVNEANAEIVLESMGDVFDALDSDDGPAAAAAVFAFGGAAQGVLVAPSGQQAQPDDSFPTLLGVQGTCTCAGGSCTIDGSGNGAFSIDGSLMSEGGDLEFNLTIVLGTAGFDWDWTYTGSVSASETAASGALSGNGELTVDNEMGNFSGTWSWGLTFDLTFDGEGCPSGTVDATVSYVFNADGQSGGNYDGQGTVTLDGDCS